MTAQAIGREQQEPASKEGPPLIMPSSRFWLMISIAAVFDLMQILVALLFLNPAIAVGIFSAFGTSASCQAFLHLGSGFCNVLAGATGGLLAILVVPLDGLSAGALTAASNSIGQFVCMGISTLGIGFFIIWFFLAGVRFSGGTFATKRFGALGVQWIVELIPYLGALPSLTATVAYMCVQSKKEDVERALRAA